jgi:hypothetical protein
MFLGPKPVDEFAHLRVYAFACAGGARFLLLGDRDIKDGIATFFSDVYDSFVRVRFAFLLSLCLSIAVTRRMSSSAQIFGMLFAAQLQMNPFFDPYGEIASPAFASKVAAAANRFL